MSEGTAEAGYLRGEERITTEHAQIDFSKAGKDAWYIDEVFSGKPGEGKKVVEEFVKRIGPGQDVRCGVAEEATIARLNKLGILSYVESTGRVMLTDNQALFRSLKLTRMLQSGGVRIDGMEVTPWKKWSEEDLIAAPGGYKVDINLIGHTRGKTR